MSDEKLKRNLIEFLLSVQPHMEKGRKLGKDMSPATAATRLTEDMLVEILVKLPVKSLLRFRCVSKSWFNLIKSPNFIEMHLKHHSNTKNDECVAIFRFDYDISKCVLSFHSYETLSSIISSPQLEIPHIDVANLEVCGPCNGLICVSDDTNIVLCNPAMREFKLLPLSPCLPCPEGYQFTRESIGFGFDSSTNDYKVVTFVSVTQMGGSFHYQQLEIYYLSTNSWIEYDLDQYPDDIEPGRYGTLFNGEFHWVAWHRARMYIMSMDMSTEVFSYTEIPFRMFKSDSQWCLKVFDESLALWSYKRPLYSPKRVFVDVWVMHEFGKAESFRKRFRVGPLTGIRDPVMIWKNEAFLMENLEERRQLVSCALDTHEITHLDIHGFFLQPMVYKESLVSIK